MLYKASNKFIIPEIRNILRFPSQTFQQTVMDNKAENYNNNSNIRES